jgi:hypothetical protein
MQVLKMITLKAYVCDENTFCYFINVIIWNVRIIRVSAKSCLGWFELHPSFDASSPLGCCLQSHEILLNKGMKYWNLGLMQKVRKHL